MKKIFTLIATALLALTANAETIASWKTGTATGTWTVEQAADGYIITDGTGKYNSNSTSVNAIKFTKSIVSSGEFQAAYKVTVEGGFKKGDKITVQPFTSMNATDYAGGSKYANILVYSAEKKQIADLTGSAAGALTVTDGHEEAGEPKTFDYTLDSDYDALYFGRGGNTNIYVMNIEIVRGEDTTGGGEAAPATSKVWDFSTFAAEEAEYTSPYDYDGLSCVMTYVSGKDYITSKGFHANGQSTATNRYISFKPTAAGTLSATFTSNNAADAANRTTAIGTKVTKDATAETDGVLAIATAETGTVSAPVEANTTYYIWLAVGGQTIKTVTYEPSATAVEAIAENAPAVAKAVKVIKNGKLYIGNYNVAGQQVK
ncbi:MAG: hypothetical protein IJ782_05620 [Prevotella sp.]|nr:hypothetical protein [Prevotella sp.]